MQNYWRDNPPVPLDLLSTKIKEQFNRDWEHNCSTKPKLRTYAIFKDKVEVASRVNCNMPKFGSCLVCNSDEVENEKHFLFDCLFYLPERNRLEDDLACNLADLALKTKFKMIFDHPFKLAKYVRSAMFKRRQKLYNSA